MAKFGTRPGVCQRPTIGTLKRGDPRLVLAWLTATDMFSGRDGSVLIRAVPTFAQYSTATPVAATQSRGAA